MTQPVEKIFKHHDRPKMKGFVGVTDNDWFVFLSQKTEIGNFMTIPLQVGSKDNIRA